MYRSERLKSDELQKKYQNLDYQMGESKKLQEQLLKQQKIHAVESEIYLDL